ncbi:hypothetical protein N6H18_07510 [Reichenbachiella agarivorans]|uniref:Uncharacterized protein n=1 Tax=Reichenbachiella agarivorans TaxID=2979464 RepID=A0ABY6CV64_9BACT|nr:hypothetical protein [Reichenbachiella agarivorans]UXP33794.1 hypothetical protein N6H18_07510 [Reichenbachiella agarivorans]
MRLFEKKFSEISPWSLLWLLATIFGNPIYNVIVYLILIQVGAYIEVSTNVTLVSQSYFILFLLIIFGVRYVAYRIFYVVRLKDQMNTAFFVEAFLERHKFQVVGMVTFLMWTHEVEGNIAGFIYFPVTILLTLSVSIVTLNRLLKMRKYLDKFKART